MLTPTQWAASRRVDHLTVPVIKLNVRFRKLNANQRPDLKMFDPLVQAFAMAPTELDKIMVLGDIFDLTTAFLDGAAVSDRYLAPVRALQTAAVQELTIRFGADATPIRTDILSYTNMRALPQKTLNLNVYYIALVGANPNLALIDAVIDQHVTTANTCKAFVDAKITVARANAVSTILRETASHQSLLLVSPPAPAPMAGKFQDSMAGGTRLIEVLGPLNNPGVDVVYVEEFDQNDIQGRTFRVGQDYGGQVPVRPVVTVRITPAVGDTGTHATTLVHELGHALSSNAEHTTDRSNLMASGAIRNGTNELKSTQVGWYRNNPWVV